MFRIKFFIYFLCLIINVSGFIQSGWYRTSRKGSSKITISVVIASFNEKTPSTKSDYLKIKSNRNIEALPKGAVQNLRGLRYLELSNCKIQHLQPECFENLPLLENLHLEDNYIKTITKGVFNELPVRVLLLHRNQIAHIESSAFDNMPNLQRIKLNFNQLTKWDPNWFQNTPKLSDLFFRRNFLKYIPEDAFRNLRGEHENSKKENKKTVDLKLFLSKNNISSLHPQTFRSLSKINQLWLDRNNLTEFPGDLFKNLVHLDLLMVARNGFTKIDTQLFENLKSPLKILDYSNNRVTCIDLDLLKFSKMISINNRRVDCACVEKVNKYISEKTSNLTSPLRPPSCNEKNADYDEEYGTIID